MLFWADYYLRWWRLPIEERACRKTDLGGGDYYLRNSGLPSSCKRVKRVYWMVVKKFQNSIIFFSSSRTNFIIYFLTQDSNCCMTRAGTTCTVYALIRSALSRLPYPVPTQHVLCNKCVLARSVKEKFKNRVNLPKWNQKQSLCRFEIVLFRLKSRRKAWRHFKLERHQKRHFNH